MSCDPSFELQFSRNTHDDKLEKEKHISLIQEFIGEFNEKIENNCKSVVVSPVSRLGFSGAKVFYVDIHKKSGSSPYAKVAKFDKIKDISGEAEKAKKFGQQVYGPYSIDELGLLIYDAIPDGKEFFDIMFEKDTAYCCSVLSNLYNDYIKSFLAISTIELSQKNLLEDYTRYLHRKNNPVQKAQFIAEFFKTKSRTLFSFYNSLIDDPKYINQIMIHGDLHAKNIIANHTGSYLIDFDWVDNGHVAKDFTLLESTVLYMILPELVTKKSREHISNDELAILHDQLYSSFELSDFTSITETETKEECFIKAFEVIKLIRFYAKKVLEKFYNEKEFKDEFEEYKYSLILIGLSQISFQDAHMEILVNTTDYIIGTME